jgi:hypothetical protein
MNITCNLCPWGTLVKKNEKYVSKNIGCGKNYKLNSFKVGFISNNQINYNIWYVII